jgi:tetratricopeptide (TPR) repeat protein
MNSNVSSLIQAGWDAIKKDDISQAISVAQSVLAEEANHPLAMHLLGWAAVRDAKPDIAIELLGIAHKEIPRNGVIAGDYFRTLVSLQKTDEAISKASIWLERNDGFDVFNVYYSRATAYFRSNQLEKSISDFNKCLEFNPARSDVLEYRGFANLKLGQIKQGFRDLTARKGIVENELNDAMRCSDFVRNNTSARVLIKRNMGLGDELTYLRYLPWLIAAGAKVDYWCGRKLKPLLDRLDMFNAVYSDSQPAPNSGNYDLCFTVNDLPVAVECLGAPDIASPLLLTPKSELVNKWQQWLKSIGPGPYIGVNWRAGASGDEGAALRNNKLRKMIEPEIMATSLGQVKATFVSLQRNATIDEIQQFENALGQEVKDFASITDELEDLLALLWLLDENIGVSNTNMHLRASLGLGSRVLVQNPGGDWRWGYQGAQTDWFEGSQVYRQQLDGSWNAALSDLQADLSLVYGKRANSEHLNHLIKKADILQAVKSRRIIWVTAGFILNQKEELTSTLASTRYRVIMPSQNLQNYGWESEYVNESISQMMGGWGSFTPRVGDTVVISKVFTKHAINLAQDAKARGARLVVDLCDNYLSHPKRGMLQRSLLTLADLIVASTETLAQSILALGYKVAAVISDPVEMPRGVVRFNPDQILKLLWFGHANNIDTLAQLLPQLASFSQKQQLRLSVVTTLQNGAEDLARITPCGLDLTYIPWSLEATQAALKDCDLVVIPTLASEMKKAKSPNRLLEALWAGRMVIAGPLPAYIPFMDSAWICENLIEGLQWVLNNQQQIVKRIELGQTDIENHFTEKAIGKAWEQVISKLN